MLRSATRLFVAAGCLVAACLSSAEAAFPAESHLVAQVRVHLLTSREEPALHTTLTGEDIARIFTKVNSVWSSAGIYFHVESIVSENPPAAGDSEELRHELTWLLTRIPPDSRAPELLDVYYVKQMRVNGVYFVDGIFVKDTASLVVVAGGLDEPIPRVTAHELGHALRLDHRQDVINLMASGTTGTALNQAEIARARSAAAEDARFTQAADLLARADELYSAGGFAQARPLYKRLAALPFEAESLKRITVRGEN